MKVKSFPIFTIFRCTLAALRTVETSVFKKNVAYEDSRRHCVPKHHVQRLIKKRTLVNIMLVVRVVFIIAVFHSKVKRASMWRPSTSCSSLNKHETLFFRVVGDALKFSEHEWRDSNEARSNFRARIVKKKCFSCSDFYLRKWCCNCRRNIQKRNAVSNHKEYPGEEVLLVRATLKLFWDNLKVWIAKQMFSCNTYAQTKTRLEKKLIRCVFMHQRTVQIFALAVVTRCCVAGKKLDVICGVLGGVFQSLHQTQLQKS